jgi:hypothetical protein
MNQSAKLELSLRIGLLIAGVLSILYESFFYINNQMLFLGAGVMKPQAQTVLTVVATLIILIGLILVVHSLTRILGLKLSFIMKKSTLRWAALYSLLPIFLEGMVHFGLSGFPYPRFVFIGAGVPMFNPAVSMYFKSFSVGVYLYPLQVLQTVSSSIMAGALISLIIEKKTYRRSASLAYGTFAVCPFCAISSIPYGLVATSLTTTAISFSFLNFFDSLTGLIITSLVGQFGLMLSLVYVSRKSVEPKELSICGLAD